LSKAAVAVFLLLVGATFGAFFAAQRLKGAAPVVELRGAKRAFSPNGDGVHDVKRFGVAVRDADELTVDVLDRGGNEVRRLADRLRADAQRPSRLRWDGRDDAGAVAPDGFYQVRVSLGRTGRSVVVPTRLRVDTRAPRPYVRGIEPTPIVPPGTADIVVRVARVSSRTPTEVRVWRTDVPEPVQVATGQIRPGLHRWRWDGRTAGRPVPAGTYVVQIGVTDEAGNVGRVPAGMRPGRRPPGRPGLTVRALAAQPPTGPVAAGERVTVGVDSRHRPYTWQLRRAGRSRPVAKGRQARPGLLSFKAPAGPSGLHLLELTSGPHRIAVPILVQARRRTDVLVVVPMLTWLGTVQVDDDADGFPDTLPRGGPVRWPRVLPGLPPGLAAEVAPLLVFLDRAGVPYDLTSDLALMHGKGPSADDRPGVLLAGSQRWITAGYARRLRRYVLDGGRLASFGADSLRRGVLVPRRRDGDPGVLRRPTQPIDRDPLGARLEPLRRLPAGTELRPIAGNASAPLLSFWDGSLGGFPAVEESAPPAAADRIRIVAGVGVEPVPEGSEESGALPPEPRPALTQARLGKGTVIRVGVPGWAGRLGEDPDVDQLTRNVLDILRGTAPKPRGLR
jgi:flagellar hook assembly protein FlgD